MEHSRIDHKFTPACNLSGSEAGTFMDRKDHTGSGVLIR